LTFPSEPYCQVFDRAFPDLAKNPWRVTAKSCATYFRRISDDDLAAVRLFIEALRPCVIIKDLTGSSVALGYRARKSGSGGLERTELGQLMSDAKPYGKRATESHLKAGTELANRMCTFVTSMPFYRDVDGFVAVPSSDPRRAFSLPRGFARELAKHTGKLDLSAALTKSQSTRELKNLAREKKLEALVSSITVDGTQVTGKSIVVVDDLYQSGLTINFVAEMLRATGAKDVFGLAAVKTLRDDDNLPKAPASPQDDDLNDEDLF
jgi:predicted amidophosphoribosyltransferase